MDNGARMAIACTSCAKAKAKCDKKVSFHGQLNTRSEGPYLAMARLRADLAVPDQFDHVLECTQINRATRYLDLRFLAVLIPSPGPMYAVRNQAYALPITISSSFLQRGLAQGESLT